METLFNPTAKRIHAPYNQGDIFAYQDTTPQGKKRWRLNYPHGATPKGFGRMCGTWTEPGSPEHKAAFERASAVLKQLAKDHINQRPSALNADTNSIQLFDYLQHRFERDTGKNKSKQRRAIQLLKASVGRSSSSLLLKDLRLTHWRDYKSTLLQELPTKETARGYAAWVSAQLTIAVEDGLLEVNPWKGKSIPVGNYHRTAHKKLPLTLEQLSRLKQVATRNPEVLKAFLFGCMTGAGLTDIKSLKHSNVRLLEDGTAWLTYTRAKTRYGNEMEARVRLGEAALKLIGPKQAPNAPLFSTLPTAAAVNKQLKRMAAAAGIQKKVTFYCCRHTYCCLRLESGADPAILRMETGHGTEGPLRRYLACVNQEKLSQPIPNF